MIVISEYKFCANSKQLLIEVGNEVKVAEIIIIEYVNDKVDK